MSKQQIEKGKKKDKASSLKCVEVVQRNSVFRRYSEAELLALLKALAVDPCCPQFSPDKIQPLLNEILIRVRNVMDLNKTEIPPWRKRKLQQFVRENRETPGLSVPNQQNGSKLSRDQMSHVSSFSCLLNSGNTTECFEQKILSNSRSSSSLLTFEDALPENQVYQESFFLDVANRSFPIKDVYQIVDSDESTNGSTPVSPENLTVNLNDAIDHLNSSTLDGVKRKHRQPPSRRSIRLLNFIGDQIDKKVIPVGPRFQADVPEWNGPVKTDDSFENSRWLGSRVWPIETRTPKSNRKKVGQGRPNSCRCESPGSADCIRRHILEKISALQSDLGPAFFSWKFDEMGDQVLKLWTLKEQQMFESLVKMKPRSNGNFIKHALMRFPKKSSKEIVHYYFNYFIPQRMSLQRGLSLKEINTDNEEEEDNDDIYGKVAQRRCEGNKAITSKSKDVKTRYLRGGC